MDIFDNPFWILGATPRDNRRRIMELVEEKSLLSDEGVVSLASGSLTNPRKRMVAEMAWLPGLGPKRVAEAIAQVQSRPSDILGQDNIPTLARANLLAAGLMRVSSTTDKNDLSAWIIEFGMVFDEIEPEFILGVVNEERAVSGFPAVTDQHALDTEIDNRRQHFRSVIREALNQLSPMDLVEVITEVVETTTDMGDVHAPLLIDDLVDTYEVEAQGFLDEEEENIDALIERIQTMADDEATDEILSPVVDELIVVVKNWDVVAQPIQVSTKSRGLGHDASARVAGKVRDLLIHLFNEHDKLELSQKITTMLQEVFAEVVAVADRMDEDASTLDEIAVRREMGDLLDPINDLCSNTLASIKSRPKTALGEAHKITSMISQMLDDLMNAGAPADIVDHGKDQIALTLMHCAVVYGNETSKWNECVGILENAMTHAVGQEARRTIRGNLLTANQNKSLYGDLTPVSSAPTLYTLNGFGFTLYGSTDVDVLSESHIATYYFTALFIPIFPITRYRVVQTGNSYNFIGKAPLRQFDKIHLAISFSLIIAMFLGAQ